MAQIKWWLIGLIILAANNIALLTWIEHSRYTPENESQPSLNVVSNELTPVKAGVFAQVAANDSEIEKKEPIDSLVISEPEILTSSLADEQFIKAFSRLSKSDELTEIFYTLQTDSWAFAEKVRERFDSMSSSEALAEFETSNSEIEKKLLLEKLASNNYVGLNVDQLKRLYLDSNFENFEASGIINKLLDIGDPDALNWAKQLVTNEQSLQQYFDPSFFTNLHEQAPDFLKNYVANLDFNDTRRLQNLNSIFYQDKDLANGFLSKNFENILNSDNKNIYQLVPYDVTFDMTESQAASLVDALESRSRNKRTFALSLVGRVKNTNLLREGYDLLNTRRDKSKFLITLLSNRSNTEHQTLGKELAASSDDSDIKRLSTYQF